jgi:hypothetical protein
MTNENRKWKITNALIAGVMKGSRFLVLKTRWITIEDKDWGMGVFFRGFYCALSALWGLK